MFGILKLRVWRVVDALKDILELGQIKLLWARKGIQSIKGAMMVENILSDLDILLMIVMSCHIIHISENYLIVI